MKFRNVERLEVVVRRFNFRAFDNRKADGNENVFNFLKNLADQVMRTDGADHAGERKIDAILSIGDCPSRSFKSGQSVFQNNFNMILKAVQRFADGPLELRRSRL